MTDKDVFDIAKAPFSTEQAIAALKYATRKLEGLSEEMFDDGELDFSKQPIGNIIRKTLSKIPQWEQISNELDKRNLTLSIQPRDILGVRYNKGREDLIEEINKLFSKEST